MNHNHQDRGLYHHDCSACRFLSKLMAEAGYAQPNQAAFGSSEIKVTYADPPGHASVGAGGAGGSLTTNGYSTLRDRTSPPRLDPPTTLQYSTHLSREHKLPLDMSRPLLVRVHQACHRRNYFPQGHYLFNYAPLHTDCVILTHGHNPEASEAVREQLSVDRPRPGGRVLSPRDQTHRDARLRQVSQHGNRESVLRSQRITAAIGKAKAGLAALQQTNGRRAESFARTIADVQMYQAKGLELHYGFDKPYTYAIAQLVDDTGVKPYLGLGTARCSDDDPWDTAMGTQLAVGRALEDIGKQMITGGIYVDELRNARRGRV